MNSQQSLDLRLNKKAAPRKLGILYILPAILVGFVIAILSFYILLLSTPLKKSAAEPIIIIARGSSLNAIAIKLEREGVIGDARTFILTVRLMGKSTRMKAGKFHLGKVSNYHDLMRLLLNSQAHYVRITIPEGYSIQDIARVLASRMNCTVNEFLDLAYRRRLADEFGIEAGSLEGYLFPDTYELNECDSAEVIIRKMLRRFFEVVNEPLREEIRKSGRNLHEVITLASIVEGECMIDAERPAVASVYLNRLRIGMKLDSDPTIQYIIPEGPRRLLNMDLEIDSPYNTYKYGGLPPGPINNPGLKSILASIRPADTKYLYMVANGDGAHTFTVSYEEFLRAKQKFQKVRRTIQKNQKGGSH